MRQPSTTLERAWHRSTAGARHRSRAGVRHRSSAGARHAIFWDGFSPRSVDLGVLPRGAHSFAEDINNQSFIAGYGDQRLGTGDIMLVARRDQEADRAAFRVDPRVDLRGEAAAASPHTTISTLFLTPEAC